MTIRRRELPPREPPPQYIVFDLDGTLCPHGRSVSENTASMVRSMRMAHGRCQVHLCTASTVGRTRPRILELLKDGILDRIWCGHGTSVLDGNGEFIERRVRRPLPQNLYDDLCGFRNASLAPKGTVPLAGDGSCYSFSILGKRFTPDQRKAYVEFESEARERDHIIDILSHRYPLWNFYLGGQTGIDIVPFGYGKERLIEELLSRTDRLTYFGDDYGSRGGDERVKLLLEKESRMWKLDTLKFVPIDVYNMRSPA